MRIKLDDDDELNKMGFGEEVEGFVERRIRVSGLEEEKVEEFC